MDFATFSHREPLTKDVLDTLKANLNNFVHLINQQRTEFPKYKKKKQRSESKVTA